ncbi:MAG: NHL repeat-containing protein [Anaerolineae bacterium]
MAGAWPAAAILVSLAFVLVPVSLAAGARTVDGPLFIRAIGGAPPVGYLNNPMGVAVSPAEDARLYVADADNARVHVFSSSGQPIGVWGTRGVGPGRFWRPTDVAVSPDGRFVYVVDANQRMVQRFEPRPECFEFRSLNCFEGDGVVTWSEAPGRGTMRQPLGATVAPDGTVYVTDAGLDTVHVFGPDGAPAGSLGRTGDAVGELNHPAGVAVTGDGLIVVADRDNNRLAFFTPKGEGYSVYNGSGRFFHPTGLALDHDGGLVVRDFDPSFGTPRLWRFDSGRRLLWDRAIGGLRVDYGFDLQGVAVLPSGGLAISDPTADEVALFILNPDSSVQDVALRGREPRQFDGPRGVALDEQFTVVSDAGNRRLSVFNNEDRPVRIIGGEVGPEVVLRHPEGVAVYRTGAAFNEARIYVADPGSDAVIVVSPGGEELGRWGGVPGDGPEQFRAPSDVAVDDAGDVYVADTNNHRIVHRGSDGSVESMITGPGLGELEFPVSVAVGPLGYIYVLEARKNRLQAYRPDGWRQFVWETDGNSEVTEEGELWLPVAVEADSQFVYVMENNGRDHVRVQVFTIEKAYPNNVFTVFADGPGAEPGHLWDPWELAVAKDGRIMIADTGNNRLQLFGWPGEAPIWTPSPTPTPTDPPFPTATPTEVDPHGTQQPTLPAPSPTATINLPTNVAPTPNIQPTPEGHGRRILYMPGVYSGFGRG